MGVAQRWLTPRIQACERKFPSQDHDESPADNCVNSRFVKVLVVEIFSSVLGLFGLIIGLLVSSDAPDFKAKSG